MLRENSIHEGCDEVWSGPGERPASWKEIDRELRRLARQRAALDAEEARWLRDAVRAEIWHELGMATLHEYLEHRLGYGPRAARDRVRVAFALEQLPDLTDALEAGELPFTAIRELTRVATPGTERAWREAAIGKNVRQIEELVAGHERGDGPEDPKNPELCLQTISLELRPEIVARLRQFQRSLGEESDVAVDDTQVMATLLDRAIAPNDRPKHQVLTVVCEQCQQAWQDSGGRRFAIGRAALAMAECDAEWIDPETRRVAKDVPDTTRRYVWRRDGGHCCVPGCRAAKHLDVHHIVPRAQGGGHEPENLTLLCSGHHGLLHDGKLSITGRAPKLEIQRLWEIEREPVSGRERVPENAANADAVLALTTLGYRPKEARAAVAAAAAHVGRTAELEALIREALRRCPRPTG